MLRALTLAALMATASSLYTLYKFDAVNAFKAYSLDGSPGAFEFSPGSGENANDWVIYHQYGGERRRSRRPRASTASLITLAPAPTLSPRLVLLD